MRVVDGIAVLEELCAEIVKIDECSFDSTDSCITTQIQDLGFGIMHIFDGPVCTHVIYFLLPTKD